MKKKLLINLLLTLIISVVLTALIFIVWYNILTMSFEEKQGMGILFLLLTIGQNFAIAILTLPILFQIDNTNFVERRTKWLYLLASPIITTFIFYSFYLIGADGNTSIALLIPAFFFCLINFFFYSKLKKTVND